MFESFMGCGGQLPLPRQFLKRGHKLIQRSCGISIADEVQTGFGRLETTSGHSIFLIINQILLLLENLWEMDSLSAVIQLKK